VITFRSWHRAVALLLLVLAVMIAALIAAAWTVLPLDNIAVTWHGETFSLADLNGMSEVLFFIVAVGAVVLVFLAVMAAVIVGLGFGAIGLALGMAATVAALALVAAPFVLLAWLVWRLLRTRPASAITGP
jgi:hypothetical protein